MLCTFGGVASLIIALEADGVIKGLVSEYLREGEPYLQTSHGIMISYWDGIGHYSMLMLMLLALSTQ
ncbi:hypothetical protein LSH36_279g03135 [Paralvinella palmiformis]|uniref:Transmembrane 6 superfamily member 1/2 transmembrane domain-containing protein n=1 Tax=Paralvinella palmiformis TaxID=53620 RepID=A0AAD9JJU5_9ANNE|nr:hypothetical protein LSH36_279g03135 [Paralvinella palmiformis]